MKSRRDSVINDWRWITYRPGCIRSFAAVGRVVGVGMVVMRVVTASLGSTVHVCPDKRMGPIRLCVMGATLFGGLGRALA